MANERALGLSFIYAAQTWRQLVICYGEDEARALFGLTNILVVFGGGKDVAVQPGDLRPARHLPGLPHHLQPRPRVQRSGGTSHAGDDEPILRPEEIRQLPERHALVVAENAKPLIARLTRCIDGKPGRRLLDAQAAVKDRVTAARGHQQPDVRPHRRRRHHRPPAQPQPHPAGHRAATRSRRRAARASRARQPAGRSAGRRPARPSW